MRFVAGQGAVAEMLAGSDMAKRMAAPWRKTIGKLLLARALQRSSIGKQPLLERGDTAGKESNYRKGEPLPERRATAGKEMSATAGKKGLQRSNGLVSFFDSPLMQIIPIFVVW